MIRIQQLKLRPGHSREDLLKKAVAQLNQLVGGKKGGNVALQDVKTMDIVKQSIDARKKPEIFLIYTVDLKLEQAEKIENRLLQRQKSGKADLGVQVVKKKRYHFPVEDWSESMEEHERPVIVGTGPAGLFCGYFLAKHGYRPILLERGECVEERTKTVQKFWENGTLNTESNVQFGEGGAGTFSDGKLNTLVKDKDGRNGEVLRIFTKHGAPEEIRYESKPHIGTDVLTKVVRSMREQILEWGGDIRFQAKFEKLEQADGRLKSIQVSGEQMPCERVVLACGHSARDTFEMLHRQEISMEAKSFAVGLRVEHPQTMINQAQYGMEQPEQLPPAPYKVTAKTGSGRGVYSFCMCPGGYVVNASSEVGRLAVNGMSYANRGSKHANSAIIVQVTPKDFPDDTVLGGIAFQRHLEEKAFALGQGKVPVECLDDFKAGRLTHTLEEISHCTRGQVAYADVRSILPEELNRAFLEGMEHFGKVLPGFDADETVLSGVESRTSSPLRILRDENLQSVSLQGLFPCGEGAGYAGGITSAAMDGIRVAEAVAKTYKKGRKKQ